MPALCEDVNQRGGRKKTTAKKLIKNPENTEAKNPAKNPTEIPANNPVKIHARNPSKIAAKTPAKIPAKIPSVTSSMTSSVTASCPTSFTMKTPAKTLTKHVTFLPVEAKVTPAPKKPEFFPPGDLVIQAIRGEVGLL